MQQRNESDAKSVAFDWVNENRRALSDWNQVIWHFAERPCANTNPPPGMWTA